MQRRTHRVAEAAAPRPAGPAEHWPVVVVGAGAAGLTAAIFAGRAGARVLLLETRPTPGAKIRVSGGGRCNVLPSAVTLDDFHTAGSRAALRNILFSWPLEAVRAFFADDLGVPLKREATGKLFPADDDPRRVVAALVAAVRAAGVALHGEFRVTQLARAAAPATPRFVLTAATGARVSCDRLVLATGGLSLPKTGSDGHGFALARACGHALVPPYPALVPLRCADPRWRALAGVSLPARLRAVRDGRTREERTGSFLFTHRGFSGPVVLDLSRHLAGPAGSATQLRVRWGGDDAPDWDGLLRPGGVRPLAGLLAQRLPRRLAERLLDEAGLQPAARAADLSRETRRALVAALADFPLPVDGNEGYRTAEVTGGGVPLGEVSPRTLESRLVPGLHFAGEILDGTGRIGGFNFLWAWVTGRKAGLAAAAAASGG
ncbi:MAG: BaiN/RdsA family NAD(P)/FAD-dependent oxidoreductase [Candidatus Krumholzibacteriia bacterium]